MDDELYGHSSHNAGRQRDHTDGLVKEEGWKLGRSWVRPGVVSY